MRMCVMKGRRRRASDAREQDAETDPRALGGRSSRGSHRFDESHDLAARSVPADLRLLEHRRRVARHLEAPSLRRDELDRGVGKVLLELGRQTGGPRLVASDGTVLDGDVHAGKLRVPVATRYRRRSRATAAR
jgi:hypothetical protein